MITVYLALALEELIVQLNVAVKESKGSMTEEGKEIQREVSR